MHASKALDSPTEYKQALLLYAKKIADEGFRAKAEELIRDLFGPVFWCVRLVGVPWLTADMLLLGGLEETIGVRQLLACSNVIFYVKCSLSLVSFLSLCQAAPPDFFHAARSKTLTKLALDWQDTLKKATNDEST
jgi:protein HIRA/HIR1